MSLDQLRSNRDLLSRCENILFSLHTPSLKARAAVLEEAIRGGLNKAEPMKVHQ